jgi:hypothetical protein
MEDYHAVCTSSLVLPTTPPGMHDATTTLARAFNVLNCTCWPTFPPLIGLCVLFSPGMYRALRLKHSLHGWCLWMPGPSSFFSMTTYAAWLSMLRITLTSTYINHNSSATIHPPELLAHTMSDMNNSNYRTTESKLHAQASTTCPFPLAIHLPPAAMRRGLVGGSNESASPMNLRHC